jgi:hypothetical protein
VDANADPATKARHRDVRPRNDLIFNLFSLETELWEGAGTSLGDEQV